MAIGPRVGAVRGGGHGHPTSYPRKLGVREESPASTAVEDVLAHRLREQSRFEGREHRDEKPEAPIYGRRKPKPEDERIAVQDHQQPPRETAATREPVQKHPGQEQSAATDVVEEADGVEQERRRRR